MKSTTEYSNPGISASLLKSPGARSAFAGDRGATKPMVVKIWVFGGEEEVVDSAGGLNSGAKTEIRVLHCLALCVGCSDRVSSHADQ